MLTRLAWRSIWRHKRRTLITVSSIGFGLACAVFLIALGNGVYSQMVNDAVRMQAGHITLEHPAYREAPAVDLSLTNLSVLRRRIEKLPGVERTKLLILGQGVARSGAGAVGVFVMGVEPAVEEKTSPLAKNIVAGRYLEDKDGSLVMVGSKLARRLRLRQGKKLVLTTNDAHGELVEELYRVKGIFETGADEIDGYLIQAPLPFIRRLYSMPADSATQLGVVLHEPGSQSDLLPKIRKLVKDEPVEVYPWQEILPELAAYIQLDGGSNLVYQGLLLFLILFTIFNTILMSVMEREHEFAVLMAIGTQPAQLKYQLLMESAYIGLIGCGLGLLIGGGASYAVQVWGLDISSFLKEGMTVSGFAISSDMHAKLSASLLLGLGGIVFAATLLLSLIPMRRATAISLAEILRQ
jgi:ABC-type lipoprotein release transport system permease subunit